MKEFLIGFGFGAFTGAITAVLMLRGLIRPDVRIGKIKGRNSNQDIDLDIDMEDSKRKGLFNRKKRRNLREVITKNQ